MQLPVSGPSPIGLWGTWLKPPFLMTKVFLGQVWTCSECEVRTDHQLDTQLGACWNHFIKKSNHLKTRKTSLKPSKCIITHQSLQCSWKPRQPTPPAIASPLGLVIYNHPFFKILVMSLSLWARCGSRSNCGSMWEQLWDVKKSFVPAETVET